jgi:lysophospholipase L1-like esterase
VWIGVLVALIGSSVGAAGSSVGVVVFCDENRNGRLDPGEQVRIADVVLEAGGRRVRSDSPSGRATFADVPSGPQLIAVRPESLPPRYVAGAPQRVQVPCAEQVAIPVTLDVGGNRPYVYLALGDSITDGEGSSDHEGYRSRLQERLCARFGQAMVVNAAVAGADSHRAARHVQRALEVRPGYTLILCGTNDWNEDAPGFTVTVNSLRRLLRTVKAAHSIPLLATVIPTHVGGDPRASDLRNRWISDLDRALRVLARQERAGLVDLEAAFLASPHPADLYSDGLHPNDAGYALIAGAFYDAIAGRAQQ